MNRNKRDFWFSKEHTLASNKYSSGQTLTELLLLWLNRRELRRNPPPPMPTLPVGGTVVWLDNDESFTVFVFPDWLNTGLALTNEWSLLACGIKQILRLTKISSFSRQTLNFNPLSPTLFCDENEFTKALSAKLV